MNTHHQLLSLFVAILFTFASYSAVTATTHDFDRQLSMANEAYAGGNFDEAITLYTEIIGRHGFSPELLHNLGNSYAGVEQYGLAILQYLRGLSLAPGNDDLQGSLEIAKKNSGLFDADVGIINTALRFFDMNQWALGALGGLIVVTLLLLTHTLYPLRKGLYTSLAVVLIGSLICVSGALHQYSVWQGGIVIQPDVRILMSPFQSALSQGILDEGSRVFSERQYGKYHYIRDEKGRAGWVEASAIGYIQISHLTYSPDNAGQ